MPIREIQDKDKLWRNFSVGNKKLRNIIEKNSKDIISRNESILKNSYFVYVLIVNIIQKANCLQSWI